MEKAIFFESLKSILKSFLRLQDVGRWACCKKTAIAVDPSAIAKEARRNGCVTLELMLSRRAPPAAVEAVLSIRPRLAGIPMSRLFCDGSCVLPIHAVLGACNKYPIESPNAAVVRALLAAHPAGAATNTTVRPYPASTVTYSPLHLALFCAAPLEAILAVLEAYPEAARESLQIHEMYEKQKLWGRWYSRRAFVKVFPLHLAAMVGTSTEVLTAVLEAYPEAAKTAVQGYQEEVGMPQEHGLRRDIWMSILSSWPRHSQEGAPPGALQHGPWPRQGPWPCSGVAFLGALAKARLSKGTCLKAPGCAARTRCDLHRIVGGLPLHCAGACGAPSDSVRALFHAFPRGAFARNSRNTLPLEISAEWDYPKTEKQVLREWSSLDEASLRDRMVEGRLRVDDHNRLVLDDAR